MGNTSRRIAHYGILTITAFLAEGTPLLRAAEFYTQGVVVDGRTIEQMLDDYWTNVFTWPDSPHVNNGGTVFMKDSIGGGIRRQEIPADTFLLFGHTGTIEWDPSWENWGCEGYLQMAVEDVDRRLESANLEMSYDGIPLDLDFEAARISVEHDVLEPTDDVDNPLVRCAASSSHYWLISPMEPGIHTVSYNSDLSGEPVVYEFTVLDGLIGDLDRSGALDAADIDMISVGVQSERVDLLLDVDRNNVVNAADRSKWVRELAGTYFGDADLDGEFNSEDFVQVFEFGKYEVDGAASWAEGDWSGDGLFNSDDFTVAFQDGGYGIGPRSVVNSVPEPSSWALLTLSLIGMGCIRRNTRVG